MLTTKIFGEYKYLYAGQVFDVTLDLLYIRLDDNDIYLLIKILLKWKN